MSQLSRKKRIAKAMLVDRLTLCVIFVLVIGIFLCYPAPDFGKIIVIDGVSNPTVFGWGEIIIGQKILELILSPILIALLLFAFDDSRKQLDD